MWCMRVAVVNGGTLSFPAAGPFHTIVVLKLTAIVHRDALKHGVEVLAQAALQTIERPDHAGSGMVRHREDDARILQESFQLCQQTYNFETFFSRLQLVQRCALTLLQAKQAGCKISRQTVKACESALSAASALRLDFLDRIYTKQVTAAMQLKTPAGRRRRLEALLNELQEHDIDFMPIEDTYNEYLQRVQELMDE